MPLRDNEQGRLVGPGGASDDDGQIAVDQRLSTMICRARVTTMGKPCPPARPWTMSGTGSEQDVSVSRAPSRRDDASQPQRVGGTRTAWGKNAGSARSLAPRRPWRLGADLAGRPSPRTGPRQGSAGAIREHCSRAQGRHEAYDIWHAGAYRPAHLSRRRSWEPLPTGPFAGCRHPIGHEVTWVARLRCRAVASRRVEDLVHEAIPPGRDRPHDAEVPAGLGAW
jgi:hypothetical protein